MAAIFGDGLLNYHRGLAWKKEDQSVAAPGTTIMSVVFSCPVTSPDLPFPSGKRGVTGLGL